MDSGQVTDDEGRVTVACRPSAVISPDAPRSIQKYL